MFTRIQALRFRCLRSVDQELGRFMTLVGPNASGKTTFLDVIALLGDLMRNGGKVADTALETAVRWLYRYDTTLRMPYDTSLGAMIHDPGFRNLLPEAIFQKTRIIQQVGNQAVHESRPICQYDALQVVKELHHLCYWLTRSYPIDLELKRAGWPLDQKRCKEKSAA